MPAADVAGTYVIGEFCVLLLSNFDSAHLCIIYNGREGNLQRAIGDTNGNSYIIGRIFADLSKYIQVTDDLRSLHAYIEDTLSCRIPIDFRVLTTSL